MRPVMWQTARYACVTTESEATKCSCWRSRPHTAHRRLPSAFPRALPLVVRLFTARPPDAYGLAPVELPVGVKRHNVGSGTRLRRVNSTQSGPPVTPAGYTPAQVPFEQRAAFGRWHRWLT